MKGYDAVVVGCGGIGSAALYWLARRGAWRVLGLDQFRLGHDRGASQDHSRMIRKAYAQRHYTTLIGAAYLREHIPAALGPELYTKTCLYTLPPDRDFVLGPLAGLPQVLVAVGAGHAFKFAGLIGKILAEIALDGGTDHGIDAFRTDRPALAYQ